MIHFGTTDPRSYSETPEARRARYVKAWEAMIDAESDGHALEGIARHLCYNELFEAVEAFLTAAIKQIDGLA